MQKKQKLQWLAEYKKYALCVVSRVNRLRTADFIQLSIIESRCLRMNRIEDVSMFGIIFSRLSIGFYRIV